VYILSVYILIILLQKTTGQVSFRN